MRRVVLGLFVLCGCERGDSAPPEPAPTTEAPAPVEDAPVEAAAASMPEVRSPFAAGSCPPLTTESVELVAGQDDGVAVEELRVQLPFVTQNFAWPEAAAGEPVEVVACGGLAAFDEYTLTLVLADGDTATLAVGAPEPAPFAVGDGLVVRARVTDDPGGGHVDLLISDEQGRVRAASLESGASDYAPGWGVRAESGEDGPVVTFRHSGKQTSVQADRWRELHTPDGAYAVQGTPAAPERPTAFHLVRLHDE